MQTYQKVTRPSQLRCSTLWKQRHREHVRAYWRAWRAANPMKSSAHNKLNYAVRNGKLKRPDGCQQCGVVGRLEGHHHLGYSRPLDVIWLCPKCHAQERKSEQT